MTGAGPMLYAATVIIVIVALANDEADREEPLGVLRIVTLGVFWLPFLLACLFRREVGPIERDR